MFKIINKVVVISLIFLVAGVGFFSGQFFTTKLVYFRFAEAATPESSERSDQQGRYKNLELFQKVLNFIETNYVDDVENEQLIQGAIKGMMDTLDPHSNLLLPEVYRSIKVDTKGKFGGLGIEVGMKDNVLTIIAPIEGTPAWDAKLMPNDRIVKINGESTKGMNLSEAISKMRGDKGSRVILSIYRKGFKKVRDFKVQRREIKIKSVKAQLVEKGYGYVRLTAFNEDAGDDVLKAIEGMERQGKLKGLVFDMRNTPGGLLDQAVEASSLFVEEGVIVSTIGRNKNQKEIKHAKKTKKWTEMAVAVLVNSSTASAAEIVAGALQDHNRAIIMGEPTFGKGSVQTVIDLDGEMGLKLTVARYYTPSGRSIQEKGVFPDIELSNYDSKLLAKAKIDSGGIREKDLPGHITNGQSGSDYTDEELRAMSGDDDGSATENNEEDFFKRKDPSKDYQVQQAINYLKSYKFFEKISSKKKKDSV